MASCRDWASYLKGPFWMGEGLGEAEAQAQSGGPILPLTRLLPPLWVMALDPGSREGLVRTS